MLFADVAQSNKSTSVQLGNFDYYTIYEFLIHIFLYSLSSNGFSQQLFLLDPCRGIWANSVNRAPESGTSRASGQFAERNGDMSRCYNIAYARASLLTTNLYQNRNRLLEHSSLLACLLSLSCRDNSASIKERANRTKPSAFLIQESFLRTARPSCLPVIDRYLTQERNLSTIP